MKKNLGTIDKVIRILVAVVFTVLFFTNVITGTLGIILLVLGIVFILTSLVGFCPLYGLLGLNSATKQRNNNS